MPKKPMLYPDSTLEGSDWIKTLSWDLPGVTDLDTYLQWRGLDPSDTSAIRASLEKDTAMPFWKPAPEELKRAAEDFLRSGGKTVLGTLA